MSGLFALLTRLIPFLPGLKWGQIQEPELGAFLPIEGNTFWSWLELTSKNKKLPSVSTDKPVTKGTSLGIDNLLPEAGRTACWDTREGFGSEGTWGWHSGSDSGGPRAARGPTAACDPSPASCPSVLFSFPFYILFCFETQFLCVALAFLELAVQTRLALNSEIHLPLHPKCWD